MRALTGAPMGAALRGVSRHPGAGERFDEPPRSGAQRDLKAYRLAVPGPATHVMGPGSYGVPKLQNDWLNEVRGEPGVPRGSSRVNAAGPWNRWLAAPASQPHFAAGFFVLRAASSAAALAACFSARDL